MQVNSASSFTPQAASSLAVDNQVRVNENNDRLTARQQQQKTPQKSAEQQRANRLDIDEQAIAIVEREQQNLSVNNQASNSSNTSYDQPSQANQTAVSTYQSVDNIVKRETIEQAFGVDLYA
ncbi:hypothetical protein tinsulaeT_04140 [Thalassotalea insulae]|uniref:Uncharacterized protein n=1 Tax=Thalassotalea insulae TaxID=2056778 RepID=A0ABQ6GP40_9GAMM|nr:hypothetical protein [Thalassotalea insulae]GLX77074.1 hypothetical protein tinsulaeT_04140 [Thalassotalea insulae]